MQILDCIGEFCVVHFPMLYHVQSNRVTQTCCSDCPVLLIQGFFFILWVPMFVFKTENVQMGIFQSPKLVNWFECHPTILGKFISYHCLCRKHTKHPPPPTQVPLVAQRKLVGNGCWVCFGQVQCMYSPPQSILRILIVFPQDDSTSSQNLAIFQNTCSLNFITHTVHGDPGGP